MRIRNAKVFDPDRGFVPGDIYMKDGCFTAEDPGSGSQSVDADGCYAIPGLVDIHIHGCMRRDFTTADLDDLHEMAVYQAKNGITSLCPTTMTLPEEALAESCRNMAAYSRPEGAGIVGIHLEGPFISPEKLGAQNPAYIHKPDIGLYRRLQKAANGKVKLLAIAPEVDGALEVIDELSGELTCSLAHTTAGYDTAMEAFRRGARQVTHLYNAMPPFSHREPGVIGAALDTPDCGVELICDGVHIHPSVVRGTFAMFGDDRIILVSDSMMATGLSDGMYELGGLAVRVQGNTARLEQGGAIAGSVTNLMNCLRTAVTKMNIPLHSAVKCATVNPAKAIGVYDRVGSISPGKSADLVLLDDQLRIRQVYLRGVALSI